MVYEMRRQVLPTAPSPMITHFRLLTGAKPALWDHETIDAIANERGAHTMATARAHEWRARGAGFKVKTG